ncbi:unnamed protein product [Camellia sinensis]
MAFIQQKFMADHGTFGQVIECLDTENLEHLAMMERLLGPLPQHMIIRADLRAEKYFKRSAHLDWLERASSKESTTAVWKLPRLQSQNSKFKCFSGILCIGSLPTQPYDPTTDIPTTTTTFENPKKNFKTQVKTPGVVARFMGLDSLPDPIMVFGRKEDHKEQMHVNGRPPDVIARLMGLDGLPSQQPLHRQHKGFSKTYRQWTASLSSQRDGKPYEHRSNRKDSMALQECKDEYEVLEISKVERSSYPAKRTINSKLSEAEMAFIQQKFMADHVILDFWISLGMFRQSELGTSSYDGEVARANYHRILPAEKYFKRSARLDWLDGASSKESTRAIWKLLRPQCLDGMPPQQPLHRQHKGFSETYRQWTASVSSQREGKPYEHRSNRKDSMVQQECKDEYDALETSKVESSSYQQKRPYTQSCLRHRWRSFNRSSWLTVYRILSKMGEGPFGQVWECFDNENLEHLAMMERLLGPLPQHMIISADLRAEKYFKRSARLDWLEVACCKESTRAVWKLPRQQSKCMFVIVHVDGRPPNVIARLMGLDWLPSQQPLHRQHKGFLKTYRQWTASVSSQRDGKPYEHRSNRKDSMAQQECKDEYEVLETSKVERSSYPAKRTINSKLSEAEMAFIQQKFMADHGWLLAQLIFLVV